MDLHQYAESELNRLGDSKEQKLINTEIMKIVDLFYSQNHTGYTARYVIQVLERLLRCKPLSSLSGEDDEWEETDDNLFQNLRCPSVFKDESGKVFDVDGFIVSDDGGLTWYESSDEFRENIEFPYWPPSTPENIYLEFIGETEDGQEEYRVITDDEERIDELRRIKLEEQAKEAEKAAEEENTEEGEDD